MSAFLSKLIPVASVSTPYAQGLTTTYSWVTWWGHQFFCFSVFIYLSSGCVSTFRTCVHVYLEVYLLHVFSLIATDDRHPIRSRSIYQNAAFCLVIRFSPIDQPRGNTYCARSRTDARSLTSCSNSIWSEKV